MTRESGMRPPASTLLTGDLAVHDPALVAGDAVPGGGAGDGTWTVICTGAPEIADGCLQVRRSLDGVRWEAAGTVWERKPEWLREAVPGVRNLWAPELIRHAGTWYLYYAASTFGENRSVIALATNATLDPQDPAYAWVDRGPVIASGPEDDFNAIDPGVVLDDAGTPWMSFGSFWSGIRMVRLHWPDGLRDPDDGGAPRHLADRRRSPNAIEAPYIVARDGAFWLFASQDFCCRGVDSTYSIIVGRAEQVTGPYVDRDGVPMMDGGGTPLLATDGVRIGPGGQAVSGDWLALHHYRGDDDGRFRLEILPLDWSTGWPETAWKDEQ